MGHFVAGTQTPTPPELDWTADLPFGRFYHALGILAMSTVMDGDCGLDVMTRMVGRPHTIEARNQLRVEISDYLMDRIHDPWMHDLMWLL